MSATIKPSRFGVLRNLRHLVPVDPSDVEHLLLQLRRELDPDLIREAIRVDPERRRFRRDLAARLRSDLESLVHEQPMSSWRKPRDRSDWATLASDPRTTEFVRACARVWCALLWLEGCAEGQAIRAPDPGEPTVLEFHDDWGRLRSGLLEVALNLTAHELVDESERAAAASKRADAATESAAVGAKFRSGRARGSIAQHNLWLEDFIRAHPGKTTRELRDMIRRLSGTEGCPFEWDGEEDTRADDWSKSVKLLELIRTRRKRMNNAAMGQKR